MANRASKAHCKRQLSLAMEGCVPGQPVTWLAKIDTHPPAGVEQIELLGKSSENRERKK